MTTTTPARGEAAAASEPDAPLKLFGRAHLPLVLGAVGLVTLGAFENRAVGTALPTVVDEFDALGSFGLANAAPAASYLVALAITGWWADRRGPALALRVGAVAFGLAQLMIGTAVSMSMVIGGRILSGLAEGLLDIGLMVLIARALPPELRPRMFSLFAAMWILPSVLGPVLTGFITEQVGWRWVFIGALILLLPAWALIQPAIRVAQSAQRSEVVDPQADAALRNVLPAAVTAAVSIFALTLAGELLEEHTAAAAATILVAIAGLAWSAVKIMPNGTFRARRGLPAVITLRGAVAIAFGTPGAFLPLLLTLLHDFSPTAAGISLTITGVTWAFGSWLQGRRHSYSRVMVLRFGLGAMAIGLTLTTLLVLTVLPVWIGLAGWAIAGVGIGLSSPSLAVLILDLSDDSNQGRNNSAGQMAVSISIATGYAIAGAMVAFAAPSPGPAVFGLIIGFGAVIAMLGLLIVGRVRPVQ